MQDAKYLSKPRLRIIHTIWKCQSFVFCHKNSGCLFTKYHKIDATIMAHIPNKKTGWALLQNHLLRNREECYFCCQLPKFSVVLGNTQVFMQIKHCISNLNVVCRWMWYIIESMSYLQDWSWDFSSFKSKSGRLMRTERFLEKYSNRGIVESAGFV